MLTNMIRVELEDTIAMSLDAWEEAVRQFKEQSEEDIADSIKASGVGYGVKNDQWREHLALNASRLTTFNHVKEGLRKIIQAQRAWTPTTSAGSAHVPMDIGALQTGKGAKSKGKGAEGDGKKGNDPKGTDKGDKGKTYDLLW